jgi:hypothetical protein
MMNLPLRFLTGLLGAAILLTAGGPCKTDSVSVAISPTYSFGGTTASSTILPDSAAAYADGLAGVSAIINTSCTGDLILNLKSSTRTVGWSFQAPVATNSATPSWTAGAFQSAANYLVVSNLMYQYAATTFYSFTTSASFDFTAPDGAYDRVTFTNPLAQVHVSGQNRPYNTALVVVTHTPADPTTGVVETFTITPSNANTDPGGTPATDAGTLLLNGKHGYADAGEFSLPFQFTVTRK